MRYRSVVICKDTCKCQTTTILPCWWGVVWLSVCSEVQIVCIWSSWCHSIPKPHHLLPHLNPVYFYLSLTRVVLVKKPLNGCSRLLVVGSSRILSHFPPFLFIPPNLALTFLHHLNWTELTPFLLPHNTRGGSIAEWLACSSQAQKGLGSNRNRNDVG